MARLLMALAVCLALLGCTGDEPVETDKTAPYKPDLLHHLGDTGDGTVTYTTHYPEGWVTNTIVPNDDNNGIDAVEDANWIRLQWAPLIDTDIAFLRVYRYRETSNGIADSTLVDSVRYSKQVSYIDKTIGQSGVGIEWFYYIDVFDNAGNHTVSDTVSYKLLEKPMLTSPSNGTMLTSSNELSFVWETDPMGIATRFRLLLFVDSGNDSRELVFTHDISDTNPSNEYITVPYSDISTSELLPGTYYWRVDALGNETTVDSGSESSPYSVIIE